ncbi:MULTISPECIES: hypothetical protein [unclassified Curtobacterium]|uniref:hypothetical protein n=1 Tax=unclassified Curtobacterium TaxID=257496 RepID=UPI0011B492E6|nr:MULTISPECIES: hypothetical protein [unclassified Curtobacterium]
MDIGWISALVSVTSATVALGALVASVLDGRAGRRNAEFSVHRDLWWQRWSWVADRATSDDEGQRGRRCDVGCAGDPQLDDRGRPLGRPGTRRPDHSDDRRSER